MKALFCGTALALVIAAAAPTWAAEPPAAQQNSPPSWPAVREAATAASIPTADPLAVARAEPRSSRRPARREAASGLVKPGLWEFSAELQPADPPPYDPEKPAPDTAKANAAKTIYTSCLAEANALPVSLGSQCRLDRSERRGAQIIWWMSCPDRQVRAEGVALYAGETMNATMISHLGTADGAVTDVMQHIAGRYLGACRQQAEMPPMPLPAGAPAALTEAAPAAQGAPEATQPPAAAPAISPASANGGTTTQAAASEPSPELAPPRPSRRETRRHSRRVSAVHRSHRHGRAHAWRAYRPYGPSPYSSSGD